MPATERRYGRSERTSEARPSVPVSKIPTPDTFSLSKTTGAMVIGGVLALGVVSTDAAVVSREIPLSIRVETSGRGLSFKRFYDRLDTLTKLPTNWNTYGAEPPNKEASFWARRVLHALSQINLSPLRVGPSSDEGIALAFRSGNKRASIECLNNGDIVAVIAEQDMPPKVWFVSPDEKEIARETSLIQKFLTN